MMRYLEWLFPIHRYKRLGEVPSGRQMLLCAGMGIGVPALALAANPSNIDQFLFHDSLPQLLGHLANAFGQYAPFCAVATAIGAALQLAFAWAILLPWRVRMEADWPAVLLRLLPVGLGSLVWAGVALFVYHVLAWMSQAKFFCVNAPALLPVLLVSLFLGVLWLFVTPVQAAAAVRRICFDALRCQHCGYSLHGLAEPRCPECGRPFDPNIPSLASRLV